MNEQESLEFGVTESQMIGVNFRGNAINFSLELDELKIFLTNVDSFIVERRNEMRSLMFELETLPSEDDMLYHLEETLHPILYKSLIVSLIILLEGEINLFCTTFTDYSHTVKYNELKGNFLDRCKIYLSKIIKLDFDFTTATWSNIIGLYEVRNIIVHHQGVIPENYNRNKIILDFIKKHDSFCENSKLVITNDACLEAIEMVEAFYRIISDLAISRYPIE